MEDYGGGSISMDDLVEDDGDLFRSLQKDEGDEEYEDGFGLSRTDDDGSDSHSPRIRFRSSSNDEISTFTVVKDMGSLATTVFMEHVVAFSSPLTDALFVGHLGVAELGAAAQAMLIATATLLFGFFWLSSMDIISTQAYRAGSYKVVGTTLQTSLIVSTIAGIIVGAIWVATGPLLLSIGQDEELATMTGTFCRLLLPGLFPLLYSKTIQKYLQLQGVVIPSIIIGVVSSLGNVLFNWFFIYFWGLGFIGSPISASFTRTFTFVLLLLYTAFSGIYQRTWYGWDLRAAVAGPQLKVFLKNGGITATIFFEATGWGISGIVVGCISGDEAPTALSAHLISYQTMIFCSLFLSGLGVAASVRISSFLDENSPKNVRKILKVVGVMSCLVGVFHIGGVYLSGGNIARLFTNDENVIQLFQNLVPTLCGVVVLYGLLAVVSAILGVVDSSVGSVMSFVGYYLITTPWVIYFVIFLSKGLEYVWIGIGLGQFVIFNGILFYLLLVLDWDQLAERSNREGYQDNSQYHLLDEIDGNSEDEMR